MATKIVIGLDGTGTGERALTFAKNLASLIGDCELIAVYVIEWSPYSFQTAEENAERHKRREQEIATATQRIIDPAIKALTGQAGKVSMAVYGIAALFVVEFLLVA